MYHGLYFIIPVPGGWWKHIGGIDGVQRINSTRKQPNAGDGSGIFIGGVRMISKVIFVVLNLLVLFFFIHKFGFTEYSITRIIICIFIYLALYIVTKKIQQKKNQEENRMNLLQVASKFNISQGIATGIVTTVLNSACCDWRCNCCVVWWY